MSTLEQSANSVPPPLDDASWNSLFALEESEKADTSSASSASDESPPAPLTELEHANGVPKPKMGSKWVQAEQAFKQDQLLELTVVDYNKGGLLVEWQGLQGFVPASQLLNLAQFHIESERIRELKRRINTKLKLKIIELDRSTNRLIFSERTAQVQANDRFQLLDQLIPDSIVSGVITNLTNFGAFVDLGGVEGLIHISEISWGRVEHPSHVLTEGETVKLLVLSVNPIKERIALSLKRLSNNPWQDLEKRYYVGQEVTGTVSNILHFGAFVQVEDGLEGLVHISELAEGTFLHPKNVVSLGQKVQVRVIEVDGKRRRLALSLRKLKAESKKEE